MKDTNSKEPRVVGIKYQKNIEAMEPPGHSTTQTTFGDTEISTISKPPVSTSSDMASESDKSDVPSRFTWRRRSSNKVQPAEINPPSDLTKYAVPPYENGNDYVVNNSVASSNQSFPQLREKTPQKTASKEPSAPQDDPNQQSTRTRRISQLLLNICLVGIFLAYAFFGGSVFVLLERQHSLDHYKQFEHARYVLKQSIVNMSVCNETNDVDMKKLEEELNKFEETMNQIICQEKVDITGENTWTFWNAVFFSATVITTIGYGNNAPVTVAGRSFCMVYAVFGIALLLLVLASLGSIFARGATLAYLYVRLSIKIARGQEKIKSLKPRSRRKRCKSGKDGDSSPMREAGGDERNPKTIDDKWKSEYEQVDEKEMHELNSRDTDDGIEEQSPGHIEDGEDEDDVKIPVLGVLLFAFIYIMLLGWLLTAWEEWEYFEAFYFSFITQFTLTTIGFGDVVPHHQKNLLGMTFFILLGMAIMSMCIALAQDAIMKKIAWASQKIGVAIIKSKPTLE